MTFTIDLKLNVLQGVPITNKFAGKTYFENESFVTLSCDMFKKREIETEKENTIYNFADPTMAMAKLSY